MIKKLFLAVSVLCSVVVTATAQHRLKFIEPSKVNAIDLSSEGEKKFNRWVELISKETRTDEEDAFVEKCTFSEAQESYWGTPPSVGCSWYCGAEIADIKSSSFLPQSGSTTYTAGNIHDFNYKNVWAEGVPGYGEGEYIVYTFPENCPRLTTVIVANGHVKSEKAWRDNSRVKTMLVYYDGKPYAILNLEDSRSEQTFELCDTLGYRGDEAKVWTLKFEILEVYPGEKYDDTVISELYFDGIDVHCFIAGTKVKMSDGSEKNIEDIKTGDSVLTYNMETNTTNAAVVEATDAVTHDNLVKYKFASGRSITATQDHPFLLSDNTWASYAPEKSMRYDGYEAVKKIEKGCVVKVLDGDDTIVDITLDSAVQKTYTITKIEGASTFIANGIVVGVEFLK